MVERLRIIETARQEGIARAVRQYQCSRTTVYALLARYEAGGLASLLNRPRGPQEPVMPALTETIVAMKVEGLYRSTTKVQQLAEKRYGWRMSRQTVWRLLSARGLARLADPAPLQRFAQPQPNQLWRIELKENAATTAGHVHLVTLVDDAKRFCLGGQWVRRKTAPRVLGALVPVFRRWGMPDAVLSDRGTVFYGPALRHAGLTTYQLALEALGIRVYVPQ